MTKGRLEAFSDGVLAIIITIMVLEIKIPLNASLGSLVKLIPIFLSYLLSFVVISIYWWNHHHLITTLKTVNSPVIWSNMHLLFWLSLIPFTTGWMGENNFEKYPVMLYGINQFICSVSFFILQKIVLKHHNRDYKLADALEKQDRKGLISNILYALSIPAVFVHPFISVMIYVIVAIMWFVPNKSIEEALVK